MRKRECKVGARVRIKDKAYGKSYFPGPGTIVFVFPHGPYVGVEFDDVGLDNAGHSINGLAADGHGWNLTYEELDLVKEPPAPSSQELAWFDYCDQLEGKLSRTEEEAKNLFLAGWEAAKGGGP